MASNGICLSDTDGIEEAVNKKRMSLGCDGQKKHAARDASVGALHEVKLKSNQTKAVNYNYLQLSVKGDWLCCEMILSLHCNDVVFAL